MARSAKKVHKYPAKVLKNLPDGVEVAWFSGTFGSGEDKVKGKVAGAIVPEHGNAEGLKNFISLVSKHLPKDSEENGVHVATGAIRSDVRSSVSRYADPENLSESALIIPPASSIQVVNREEIASQFLSDWLAQNPGKVPTEKDMKGIQEKIETLYSDLSS